MLYRLSRDREHEFVLACTLLASLLVVHADETNWSLNSVWAFLSEKVRVSSFGVHKDAATLKKVLDPNTVRGYRVISDDAAVYANFTASQKCWAHLLRKAIKLDTLQDPNNTEYRGFTDRLLEIYREACCVQYAKTSPGQPTATLHWTVRVLDAEIIELCEGMRLADLPPMEGLENDYRLLVDELMLFMLREELFMFVTAKSITKPD